MHPQLIQGPASCSLAPSDHLPSPLGPQPSFEGGGVVEGSAVPASPPRLGGAPAGTAGRAGAGCTRRHMVPPSPQLDSRPRGAAGRGRGKRRPRCCSPGLPGIWVPPRPCTGGPPKFRPAGGQDAGCGVLLPTGTPDVVALPGAAAIPNSLRFGFGPGDPDPTSTRPRSRLQTRSLPDPAAAPPRTGGRGRKVGVAVVSGRGFWWAWPGPGRG